MFKRSFCFIDGEYLEATRAFHILGTFGLFVSFLLAFSGISGKGERFLKLSLKFVTVSGERHTSWVKLKLCFCERVAVFQMLV